MNFSRVVFPAAALVSLIFSSQAFAINLDQLQTSQTISQSTAGSTGSSVLSSTSIGGVRNITVKKTGGTGAVSLAINPDTANSGDELADHNQGTTAIGRTTITWDGDISTSTADKDSAGSVKPRGLGAVGVDFTKDGADRFQAKVVVNYGISGTLFLKMRVFDAVQSAPGLFFFSESTIPFNSNISTPTVIEFPFSSFSAPSGSDGPAQFTQIGAVQLIIDGTSSPASDMSIELIRTNGRCDLIPVNGAILGDCNYCIDQTPPKNPCGQCQNYFDLSVIPHALTPNPNYRSNCRDCLGVNCVIQGDPKTGMCVDTNTRNSCGVCDANPLNDTPDACGVCGGNGLSCAGCDNVSNSGKVPDICGVCGGNGTSCLDCAGNPFGSVTRDSCGVCGGSNACLDCNKTPFGTASIDRCGVCGGNGQSCVSCETSDLRPLAFILDATAKSQEEVASRMLRDLTRVSPTAANRDFRGKIIQQVHTLQIRNWVLSWSIDLDHTSCVDPTTLNASASKFCVESSVNTTIVDEYRVNANKIHALTRTIATRLNRENSKQLKERSRTSMRLADRRLKEALDLADQVPTSARVCN